VALWQKRGGVSWTVRGHACLFMLEFFPRLGVANDSSEVDCDLSLPVAGNGGICTNPLSRKRPQGQDWTHASWDYYGYHEDPTPGAAQDIYAPRNFRANLVTLSLRYAL